MKNKKRTDAEWTELREAQRSSGLNKKAWCRKEGVHFRSFTDWEYRNRKKDNGITDAAVRAAKACLARAPRGFACRRRISVLRLALTGGGPQSGTVPDAAAVASAAAC